MINPAVSLIDRADGSLIRNAATLQTSTVVPVWVAARDDRNLRAGYIREQGIRRKQLIDKGFPSPRPPIGGKDEASRNPPALACEFSHNGPLPSLPSNGHAKLAMAG
ncbi:MAG: hypothetical protein WB624_25705 [Xanthobacteraceae bacterium]|jgi:hypothetical protein